jgi:hypothetical protein
LHRYKVKNAWFSLFAFKWVNLCHRYAAGERFSLILGSDVCYEDPLPKALAHVLSQRLASPGLAWLVLPVRDWPNETGMAVIERLVGEARAMGLHVTVETAPALADEEYEGGTMVWRRRIPSVVSLVESSSFT